MIALWPRFTRLSKRRPIVPPRRCSGPSVIVPATEYGRFTSMIGTPEQNRAAIQRTLDAVWEQLDQEQEGSQ